MSIKVFAGTLLALGVHAAESVLTSPQPDVELGRRLYIEGILASGQPLRATTQGDIRFSGTQFSCVNCHRRSGYGSSEGGTYVLPVTGPALYNPRELDRADLFKKLFKETQPRKFQSRIRSPRIRPAYTDETLARAIREGIDPTGRTLDALMPRYELADQDIANLLAYLKRLSTTSDPGVDEKEIHFATLVSDKADVGKRDAMLATMREFVEWINLDTAGDLRNPNFSPNYRTQFIKAYRTWELDVWELKGSPEAWAEQLASHYQAKPVFAIVSGLVEGPWQPVQRFCEQQRLPCLFPHTELPVTADESIYSVHFTRGLLLEAEAIGRYLQTETASSRPIRILQIHSDSSAGTVPAAGLESLLEDSERFRVKSRGFRNATMLREQLEQSAASELSPGILMLWPGDQCPAALEWLMKNPSVAQRIFLPSRALEEIPQDLPTALSDRLYFAYPYEIPGAHHPRAFRVRAWMGTRQLDITHPRLQFDTYYALTVMQYGLEHIVDNFSRDYLLEYVEHEAENALNPGTYPRLSLGPGQRFASKGAYIVKRDTKGRRQVSAISKWIVP